MHRNTHGPMHRTFARAPRHAVLAAALLAGVMITRAAPSLHAQEEQVTKPVAVEERNGGTNQATPTCALEYQRADNMWAGYGQPTPTPGTESLTVPMGQVKEFVTDWKYEKTRNDGTTYYGSHLRVATNRGPSPAMLFIKTWTFLGLRMQYKEEWRTLAAGETAQFRADLARVSCPKA